MNILGELKDNKGGIVLSATNPLYSRGGNQIGRGWRWILLIESPPPPSSYSGLRYKIEVNYFPNTDIPDVRFASSIEHPAIDDHGNFNEQFMGSLNESGIVEIALLVYQLLQNPLKYVKRYTEEEVVGLWKEHEEGCSCAFFPLAYRELCLLEPTEKAARILKTMSMLNRRVEVSVDNQRTYMENRIHTITHYRPIHPELFDTNRGWHDEWFDKDFIEAIKTGTSIRIAALMKEDCKGVYSFNMLSQLYCQKLMEEIRNFENSDLPKQRPNSMNNYGLILNNIGLEPMFDIFIEVYMKPIATLLFSEFGGRSLDHHHTFVVEYKVGKDLSLDMHTDDSEVTLNVNLYDSFEGASLNFCGRRNAEHGAERKHALTYNHKKGRAVVHLGSLRHGAAPITSGERFNLIVWGRSSQYREQGRHREYYKHFEEVPDPICLSKTHDQDYKYWKHVFEDKHI
uniref:Fe2OG dioxygenase domain-containing protein n=1 Tax=Arcella intermedia TaxID=1963864 RepID=A0A6B2L3U1_9EUKA